MRTPVFTRTPSAASAVSTRAAASASSRARAFGAAQQCFDVASMDLIYGRPGQSPSDWKNELARALSWGPHHLSLYQLTVEPRTAFFKAAARGELVMPSDDVLADLYTATQDLCSAHGLSAYEVSNHATPGAECRHNLGYWRAQDYVGVGPGAHGRLTIDGQRFATETERRPQAWLDLVERNGCGQSAMEPLSPQAQGTELLLMGLRSAEGIALDRFTQAAGKRLDASALDRLCAEGFVQCDGVRLQATARGRLVLDSVVAAVAP